MTVELPFAPVDSVIRQADPDIRVSASASERLALRIQEKGSEMAVDAAKKATENDRKTIMPQDFGMDPSDVDRDGLTLPIAPIDRIARLKIDDYRVSQDARVVLADYLEDWSREVAKSAAQLARHAGRRTVQKEDIDAYFEICGGED
ncbi:MAG: histone [Halobacteria archaeon]|nr:histone [Halobacteria archaeon]